MAGIRDELRRIHDMNGGLAPEVIVKAAKSTASPLHSCFEWDDRIGGHKYRLVQAQKLIREQWVEYAHNRQGPKKVRQYVSTYEAGSLEPRGVYRDVADVMKDDFSAEILLRNFERAIADLKRSYGHLKEFREMLLKALV